MGEIMSNIDRIRTDVPVIIHCRSGARSAAVVNALQNNVGLTNLHNLTGGIMAWAREIDPSLDV
jgi:rhodanese-related sulfurtransferase